MTRELSESYKSEIQTELMTVLDCDMERLLLLVAEAQDLMSEAEQFIGDLQAGRPARNPVS